MQVNPKIVKKQFEKHMDKYNQNAIVQESLAKKMVDALCNIQTSYDNILELGSGTGLLTQEIVKRLRYKKYFANDLILNSKKYLDKILPEYSFIQGNAGKIKPPVKMHLIISNAMFQWFKNLEKQTHYLSAFLERDGILAFSIFSPDNFKEIRETCGLTLNYKSIDEIKSALNKDYKILYAEEYTQVLNFSSPLELLAHMKNTGVNSLSSTHWTFKDVKEFCTKYTDTYPDIKLTYAPVIIIAQKITR